MNLYPAIDIKDGRCVRLIQGKADQETRYFDDPVEPAKIFKSFGANWVHVVDLDGAFHGEPTNLNAIRRIVAEGMQVELGGGMRDFPQVEAALNAGVSRVIIGTRACTEPEFVGELIKRHGAEAVAVGIDAKDGLVAVKGWVETSSVKALDLAQKMESLGVRYLIYTDISRDGMLTGPNFEAQQKMLELTSLHLIASGGVSSNADIKRFLEMSKHFANLEGVIVGKAFYDGHVDLKKAYDELKTAVSS